MQQQNQPYSPIMANQNNIDMNQMNNNSFIPPMQPFPTMQPFPPMQPMQQQSQILMNQLILVPQPIQINEQKNEIFYEVSQLDTVTFRQKPNCLGCFIIPCCPKYSFHTTNYDREIGQEILRVKPTKNFFCCCYENQIRNLNDNTLLTSNRPCINGFKCQFCDALGCCCLDLYTSKGQNIYGKQRLPCCGINLCCLSGQYVYVFDQEKYYIGEDKQDFCCGGEWIAVKDIWDNRRNVRLGAIYYIFRARCCSPCGCLFGMCCGCWDIYKMWKKVVFPKNVPQADKAMILAAVSNGLGEDRCCCIPYCPYTAFSMS